VGRRLAQASVALPLLLLAQVARAQAARDTVPEPGDLAVQVPPPPGLASPTSPVRRELRYNLRYDIPIFLVGYISWTTLEQLRPRLTPTTCRLCDTKLNAVDDAGRGLVWQNKALAGTFSDITANAIVPAATVGLNAYLAGRDGAFSNVPLDLLFVAQAVSFANAANLVGKYAIARRRPYARDNPADPASAGGDANISLYSGHTSYAFALAVSSGTVASMRGYRGAGYLWVTGLTLATATAYFRVAANQHYVTDVVTGAVAGSAFGFLFPYLLHRPILYRSPILPNVAPVAGGAVLSVSGAW
jgi:membrane-associated phospholipid phosphatase